MLKERLVSPWNIFSPILLTTFFGASLYCSILNRLDNVAARREKEAVEILQEAIRGEESRYELESKGLFREFWRGALEETNYLQRMQILDENHEQVIDHYRKIMPINLEKK